MHIDTPMSALQDESDGSDTESEFEAEQEEESESDASVSEESAYSEDASDDTGSVSGDDDDESEGRMPFSVFREMTDSIRLLVGEDWDELERKAAKCMSQSLSFSTHYWLMGFYSGQEAS